MRTIQTVELDLVQEQTGIRRPIGVMAGVANSVWRVLRNRWAANRLHELDDYQLDDIGLTRHDVMQATHRSGVFDDPAALLAETVRRRGKDRFERLRRS
ncbi:DUF1127 domain-containing protein [Pseudorhizobium marinum]|jgi:uncharacterized protein YjiS (DUF1127 family)|uniref:DUF1127 domain-containing protein n=1 Tax=Pseudorhizobium marinum TaxID=1496690 RepID=UPI0004951FBC|nr:DUF1127 domain-containing protein [Pseudorhizobium marinum]MBU1314127.1 DUF1127 domain-containing protein [Alphaproteobacteria bacterium]MDY6962899.1 DUF1127 domain-containing protein [Pseudomonadota bacterium]MBU1552479.1 DUF1127 domain-containing protein [Alphaproteobacteria bacterium]MBU2339490.1 DUF1127 domain-containing protein [Alphaproteobacteria bacterium]MBU2390202.1 DUF1127 domain-containing protein [Alphaproteobacteria bacterium]|tara:strand:+ start:233 stop:529 length:297 start_codon:yes stop_codon:yes gene_type:complete